MTQKTREAILEAIQAIVRENPGLPCGSIVEKLHAMPGLRMHPQTVRLNLRRLSNEGKLKRAVSILNPSQWLYFAPDADITIDSLLAQVDDPERDPDAVRLDRAKMAWAIRQRHTGGMTPDERFQAMRATYAIFDCEAMASRGCE